MKNLTKTGVFIAGFFALILLSVSIPAETATDDTEDVWVHQLGSSGMSYREYSGSRDNVDITSVSYELSDSTVTASLTVAGEIVNDMYHTYIIYLENPSGQYYATYSAGSGMWIGNDKYGGEMGQLTDPVSGDTFTAIFEINHPEDSFNLYGSASESVDATEAYYDFAPNMFAPYYEGSTDDDEPVDDPDPGDSTDADDTENANDSDNTDQTDTTDLNTDDTTDDGGGGIPGFETIALIAAIGIALILLKRKNKK